MGAGDLARRVDAYAAHLDHGDTCELRRSPFGSLVASQATAGREPIAFPLRDEGSRADR